MHRHIITEHGVAFAAELVGDTVTSAIEVEQVEQHLLDQQVEEAKQLAYDNDQRLTCEALTLMLLRGEATTIGAYFEVGL